MLSVVRCDFLSPYARISFAITTNDSIITIIIEIPNGWWMYDSFTYIKKHKTIPVGFLMPEGGHGRHDKNDMRSRALDSTRYFMASQWNL